MEYVLGAALLVLASGLVWACVTAVRLALELRNADRKTHEATTQRDAADLARGTEAARADQNSRSAEAGSLGTQIAARAAKEVGDVQAASTARDVARAVGVPAVPGGGVPDVPGPAAPAATPLADPFAVRDPLRDRGA